MKIWQFLIFIAVIITLFIWFGLYLGRAVREQNMQVNTIKYETYMDACTALIQHHQNPMVLVDSAGYYFELSKQGEYTKTEAK